MTFATQTETIPHAPPPRPSFWREPGGRFLILLFLIVAMTIPLFILGIMTAERENYRETAMREIGSLWSGPQRITGPLMVLPVQRSEETETDEKIQRTTRTRYLVLSPDTLNIDAQAETQTRSRGIFDSTVYGATARFEGGFSPAALQRGLEEGDTPLWDRSYLAVHISDVRGFTENPSVTFAGHTFRFEPSENSGAIPGFRVQGKRNHFNPATRPNFLSAQIGDPRGAEGNYAFSLALKGSGSMHFASVGQQTTASMKSDWPHPSFDGAFLPVTREISESGFTASWSVPLIARGFPSLWKEEVPIGVAGDAAKSAFGVEFYQPVNLYQKVQRALKYAVLFIGLTFLSVFLIELATGKRTHAVQYLLVGLAQCVFFLLLLALSEQIGFARAYLAASAGTVGLLTAYVALALKAGKATWLAGAVFVTLYAFLYLLLESQDYALLIGAIASFLVVAITMIATRNINWWGSHENG